METVLSYVELLIIIIGKTEHISLWRHCLVECCIEYNDLRNVCGDNALAGTECECVSVVVYGSELAELVYLVDDLVGNEHGLVEYVSALYYTVTNSGYLVHAVYHLSGALCESLNELHECLCVGGESAVLVESSAVGSLVSDMTVNADTLAKPLCQYLLLFTVDQLIF